MPPISSHAPINQPDVDSCVFDGNGGAQRLGPNDLERLLRVGGEPGFGWIHLRLDGPNTASWLEQSDLDRFVIDALTAADTRPRCTVHGEGIVLILRGVNLNPGAEPEDMVSIRLWIEKSRVVSVWLRSLLAVRDLFEAIERGHAPATPGELVARLALRLADRAEPTIATFNERIDTLEEAIVDEAVEIPRRHLADVRRVAIVLRRYMFPQRDALTTLEVEDLSWLTDRDRSRLREAAERVTRLAEDLDSIRDRAQVIHDQVMERRAEVMNRQMLVLSIAAAMFLPLGLLTGLLGINVGGMPGVDSSWAFWIVCALLLAMAGVLVWLFKHLGLLR
ncbi:MAG: zinc transporter ZntB [Rhizobiales bacterium]|nr:zinc transporter ZntB [Hyphomicrobiales bacterium]